MFVKSFSMYLSFMLAVCTLAVPLQFGSARHLAAAELPNFADLEVVLQEIQNVGNEGDATGQGKVNCFDFLPRWKGPVGNDESVGVTNPGEKVVEGGVKNSFLQHECERLGVEF